MATKIFICFLLAFLLVACGANYVEENNNQGNEYTRSGNFNEAILAYQAAQVAEPDNPIAYYNIAEALRQSNEPDQAIASLALAIELAQGAEDTKFFALSYFNLGNIYYQEDLCEAAAEAYRLVLQLEPDNEDARYNLELALGCIISPTPTALEQQTEPEADEADPTMTPTPNPGGNLDPTPTPEVSPSPTPTVTSTISPTPSQTPTLTITPSMSPTPTEPTPPNPEDPPTPTPTITPQPTSGSVDEPAPTSPPATPTPFEQGTLTIEEAKQQLDAIQQDQETLQEYIAKQATLNVPVSEKDW
jgi:hypothetical protein